MDKIELKLKPKDVLFNKDSEISATMDIIKPSYHQMATAGLATAGKLVDKPAFDVSDIPALEKWIEKIADTYAEEITNTTYDAVAKLLQDGVDSGLSISELGDKVEDYFGTIAPNRADMIARTESARILTASQAHAWNEYGIKAVEWYLAGDNPCPEICIPNSRKDWSVKEAQSGTVEYSHPNCECVFLPL